MALLKPFQKCCSSSLVTFSSGPQSMHFFPFLPQSPSDLLCLVELSMTPLVSFSSVQKSHRPPRKEEQATTVSCNSGNTKTSKKSTIADFRTVLIRRRCLVTKLNLFTRELLSAGKQTVLYSNRFRRLKIPGKKVEGKRASATDPPYLYGLRRCV